MTTSAPQRVSWWQVMLALVAAPAAAVPFAPFVEGVVPWELIREGPGTLGNANDAFWLAAPALLGVWLVALLLRALARATPLQGERALTWVLNALGAGCLTIWNGKLWFAMATDETFINASPTLRATTIAALVIPVVCLATGVIWLVQARTRTWLAPERALVVLALIYLADMASAIAACMIFSKDVGWYCAVAACGGVIGELVRRFRSASPRVAPPASPPPAEEPLLSR